MMRISLPLQGHGFAIRPSGGNFQDRFSGCAFQFSIWSAEEFWTSFRSCTIGVKSNDM